MPDKNDPLKFVETTYRGRSVGKNATVEAAIEDAWEKAKKGGAPKALRVVDIYIAGNNPISEYSVILGHI